MKADAYAAFVDAARAIARDAMVRLSSQDKGEALKRLSAERNAPGAVQPRVVISVALSQARWQMSIAIAGSKTPMRIAEASGTSMLRAGEAEPEIG